MQTATQMYLNTSPPCFEGTLGRKIGFRIPIYFPQGVASLMAPAVQYVEFARRGPPGLEADGNAGMVFLTKPGTY